METENNYQETDLGNVSLNPRGEYDPGASYEYLDTVSYQGGSYTCLAEPGTTITGTAPDPGRNTDAWQMLTLPGDLTPESIAMHDDTVNHARQAESSRLAAELAFRVLSFKVIVTSLYGVSTVQYFNVSMMKCRANECRCTLGCDEDVKASHNKYAI